MKFTEIRKLMKFKPGKNIFHNIHCYLKIVFETKLEENVVLRNLSGREKSSHLSGHEN